MYPVSITLSTKVLKATKAFETVSSTFITRFSDGSEKLLNKTKKLPLGLRKEQNNSEIILSKETCTLYYKDWSDSPLFGTFDKNYPKK